MGFAKTLVHSGSTEPYEPAWNPPVFSSGNSQDLSFLGTPPKLNSSPLKSYRVQKGNESSSKHPFFEGRTVKLWVMYMNLELCRGFLFLQKKRSRQNISKFQAFPFFWGRICWKKLQLPSFLPWICQVGWHAKASGPGLPYEERGTMFGLAPRLGIGWRGEKTAGDHASWAVKETTGTVKMAEIRRKNSPTSWGFFKLKSHDLPGFYSTSQVVVWDFWTINRYGWLHPWSFTVCPLKNGGKGRLSPFLDGFWSLFRGEMLNFREG